MSYEAPKVETGGDDVSGLSGWMNLQRVAQSARYVRIKTMGITPKSAAAQKREALDTAKGIALQEGCSG